MTAVAPESLLQRAGLSEFRPGQREAVLAALAGRDSLVVMPTGGGKSLCYQLPALALERPVLVVSPLIALMTDQLRRAHELGIGAAMLASGMPEGHNRRALEAIGDGSARVILAAPERFASRAFRDAVSAVGVGLFVVDEAHCVSEWGHDFRPDYLRLREAAEALAGDGARPPIMALTATATPRVADEIAERLAMRDRLDVRAGFDRPNLAFDVVAVEGKGAIARKRSTLLHVLGDAGALPAIVYCGTRKDTDTVAELLRGAGVGAVAYHAGMSGGAREASQSAFMDGRAEAVVATSAFGMGVDKADVRTVAHWALPTSLEAYYQEAGRAGRDGEPARAVLLSSRMDLGRLIRFNTERTTSVDDVKGFVGALRGRGGGGPVAIGHGTLGEHERVLLSIAERAGAVELAPGGHEGLLVTPTGRGSPRRAWQAIKAARDRGWESYRSIERYSSARSCRREQILEHFADATALVRAGRCCDVCDPDPGLAAAAAQEIRASRGRPRAGGAIPDGSSEYEALRAWRQERAGGSPAFTVASNAVLEEVVRVRPASEPELLAIRGIGKGFCERHGESLLAAIASL